MKHLIIISAIFWLVIPTLNAQDSCCSDEQAAACCSLSSRDGFRADAHGPIGIMGDHLHSPGGIMFSYRYMLMGMEGNIVGSESPTDASVYSKYNLRPDWMNMHMHMLGLMYAPTDRMTVMLMGNYLANDMQLTSSDGMVHGHGSAGLGDLKASALWAAWEGDGMDLILQTGISIPTGSTDVEEPNVHEHAGHGHHGHALTILPYPMQLGSGTWDVLLGATYQWQTAKYSGGTQVGGTLRAGQNSSDYRLGNQVQANVWLARKWSTWLSTSVRVQGFSTGQIEGADPDIMTYMAPPTNPYNSGGQQVNASLGLNFMVAKGQFTGLRIGIEYGMPVYRNLNGIQMDADHLLTTGLKYHLF